MKLWQQVLVAIPSQELGRQPVVIQSLQAQVAALQSGMNKLLERLENTNNERKEL